MNDRSIDISRRELLAAACVPLLGAGQSALGAAESSRTVELPLNDEWLFKGQDGAPAQTVTLPHCAAKLSWQDWDPASWERVWTYSRPFSRPLEWEGRRVFLHFERAMSAAAPVLNGKALTQHLGGFLPFSYEVTELLRTGDNLLHVAIDGRWINAPPEGGPGGPASIDYLLPAGITGSVTLRAVPEVFVLDVFAKPVDVLESTRRVEVLCTVDAGEAAGGLVLEARLEKSGSVLARTQAFVNVPRPGSYPAELSLTGLRGISLWHMQSPNLYEVVVTLSKGAKPVHEYRTRIGFREARFEKDGFFLNGSRLQIFGLNRHELYPYTGFAMPCRVMGKDAEILRRELNCNMVRCSHYPPSEAFLDACDELGLLVWEELPGWQYVGDDAWRELATRDVKAMVMRDRNHPSIVVWGVRINESKNEPDFYQLTKRAAKELDDTRQTSGSMVYHSTHDWFQDVFSYDDYHSKPDGSVGLVASLPDVPFFFSEAVGQFSYGESGFHNKYRRAANVGLQEKQAIYHAQVHDRASADQRCAGVTAWCAFEYGSLLGSYRAVKYPGVADFFRVPKLGASVYRAQVDPKVRPVIEPNFYWDFGPETPNGPGKHAGIFSNLEKLELFVDGEKLAVVYPDRQSYPRLPHPPFFADLDVGEARKPELRIDGYLGGEFAFSRSFSSDTGKDRFVMTADDGEIRGDGSDATRIVFQVVDRFGTPRLFAGGTVTFAVSGPGELIGDNPFDLKLTGGIAAVWVKAHPRSSGAVIVEGQHSQLGRRSVRINVLPG